MVQFLGIFLVFIFILYLFLLFVHQRKEYPFNRINFLKQNCTTLVKKK